MTDGSNTHDLNQLRSAVDDIDKQVHDALARSRDVAAQATDATTPELTRQYQLELADASRQVDELRPIQSQLHADLEGALAAQAAEEQRAARQRAAEQEAARKAAEEEARTKLTRQAAEEEAARKAAEEEAARRAAEEEAARRAAEEEAARRAAEEEAERSAKPPRRKQPRRAAEVEAAERLAAEKTAPRLAEPGRRIGLSRMKDHADRAERRGRTIRAADARITSSRTRQQRDQIKQLQGAAPAPGPAETKPGSGRNGFKLAAAIGAVVAVTVAVVANRGSDSTKPASTPAAAGLTPETALDAGLTGHWALASGLRNPKGLDEGTSTGPGLLRFTLPR